jgi:hypothetical protein
MSSSSSFIESAESVRAAPSSSSPPLSSPTIQVSADDFKKCNAALLRLLLTLHECGGFLPTRQLYDSAGMSRRYGPTVIKKAVDQGYIKREKVSKPQGEKGNDMMVNSLTPRACRLLERLDLA